MTKDEINRAVAEKVMGFRLERTAISGAGYIKEVCGWFGGNTDLVALQDDWNPTERIDHAWLILNKYDTWTLNRLGGKVVCRIIYHYTKGGIGYWSKGEADTPPMAISLAALEAVKEVEHE